jgi:hypothetical protein
MSGSCAMCWAPSQRRWASQAGCPGCSHRLSGVQSSTQIYTALRDLLRVTWLTNTFPACHLAHAHACSSCPEPPCPQLMSTSFSVRASTTQEQLPPGPTLACAWIPTQLQSCCCQGSTALMYLHTVHLVAGPAVPKGGPHGCSGPYSEPNPQAPLPCCCPCKSASGLRHHTCVRGRPMTCVTSFSRCWSTSLRNAPPQHRPCSTLG